MLYSSLLILEGCFERPNQKEIGALCLVALCRWASLWSWTVGNPGCSRRTGSVVHSTGWYLYGKIWQKPDGMQFICFSEDSFGKREIPLANEEEELPPFGGQNGQVSVRSSGVSGTEVSKMKHRPCKSRTFPTCELSVMLCYLVQKVSTWFRVGWGTRKVTAVRLVVFMCYCSGAAA